MATKAKVRGLPKFHFFSRIIRLYSFFQIILDRNVFVTQNCIYFWNAHYLAKSTTFMP